MKRDTINISDLRPTDEIIDVRSPKENWWVGHTKMNHRSKLSELEQL